jgi:drug/metabolite transporter (DMT)-like permease
MGTSDPSSHQRGILLMLLSVFFFSANVLVLRAISLHTPAADGFVATAFRGAVGLLIVGIGYGGRGFNPVNVLCRPMVLARGAVGAAGILLFYVTISKLGVGRAVILNLTYPMFGAGMAAVCLKERLSWVQLGWMGVALGGLTVFFAETAFQGSFTRYEVLGLLGAVVAGIAVVIIRMLRHSEHPSTVYGSQCLWSLAAALPFCHGQLGELPWVAVAGLVLAAVFVGVAQIAMTHGFGLLSVATGSSTQMIMPVVTALGGIALFGEHLSVIEVIGGGVTLGATWLAVRPAPAR